jgi:hypothetical protein
MDAKATCEWIFTHNNFISWESNKTSLNALAVVGRPGEGKSTLCEVVRFYLDVWLEASPSTCIIFVQIDLRRDGKLTKSTILSNIISQMLLACPHLFRHLRRQQPLGGPLTFDAGMSVLHNARAELDRVYVILDELDCVDDDEMCPVIDGLLSIKPYLNILVASRPKAYLEQRFRHRIDLGEVSSKKGDALTYLKSKIRETPLVMQFIEYDEQRLSNMADLIFSGSRRVVSIHSQSLRAILRD